LTTPHPTSQGLHENGIKELVDFIKRYCGELYLADYSQYTYVDRVYRVTERGEKCLRVFFRVRMLRRCSIGSDYMLWRLKVCL
jgi:hypothetical protein